MSNYYRRQFLKYLGAVSGLFVAERSGLLSPTFALPDNFEPFEVLVLGDSIASGQGLKEEQKFYTLTKNWLQGEVFGNNRQVNLKVKAHSGTTLTIHPTEAAAFAKAEIDENEAYHPEVNVSFPSVKAQIDIAAKEYETDNIPSESVNLILLSGGINDITTTVITDPFGDDNKLRSEITKYCRDSMSEILQHAGEIFPNAIIAVVGYFPLISRKALSGKLFNAILEIYNFPRPLKPVANNLFTKQFFKVFQKKSAKRSLIWLEESNRCFQEAVNLINAKSDKPRAVFVQSPINEENCFGTKNSLVFGMGKKGRTEDFFYAERSAECVKAIPKLNELTRLNYPVHLCKISGLAHPNIEGSKAYAEAVKSSLEPLLSLGQ